MNIQPISYRTYNLTNSVNQSNFKNQNSPNFKGTIVSVLSDPVNTDSRGVMDWIKDALYTENPNIKGINTWNMERIFTWADPAFDESLKKVTGKLNEYFAGNNRLIKFVFDKRTPEELESVKL